MNKWLFILFLGLLSTSPGAAHDNSGGEDEDSSAHEKDRGTIIADYEYNFAPLIIPVIKGEKIVAYLRLVIKLVTKDRSSFRDYQPYIPRLTDAIFQDLYSVLCDQWLPYKDPMPDSILKRIQKIVPTIVGDDNLLVFITSFYFNRTEDKDSKTPAG